MSTQRDEIERLTTAAARKYDTLAVGTYADGEATFFPAEPSDALYEIGSITKPITAVLLAEMSLAGEIALDDPITNHLPDEALPRWRERPPTLEELATHRAALPNAPAKLGRKELAYALGIRREDPWIGIDTPTYRDLVRQTHAKAPGKRFAYSSLGYALLGDVLAAQSGKPYDVLLHARISAPLGLEHLTTSSADPRQLRGHTKRGRPRPPLRDHMTAAGAIRATAPDLLALVTTMLEPPPTRLGAALRLASNTRFRVSKRLGMGLGWMTLQRKAKAELTFHSGGTWGFRSFAAASLESETAVVVLANNARSVDRLGLKISDILAASGAT